MNVGEVKMSETEKVIEKLNTAKLILCNQQMLTPEMCIRIGQAVTDAIALTKKHEAVPIKADKPWNKYNCPACNAPLHRTTWFTFQTSYCKYCGQAVKWE